MNKLFNKIAALSVGLAMAIGVGVAIGSKSDVRSVKAASVTRNATTALSTTAESLDSYISIRTSSSNTYTSPCRAYANVTITIEATNATLDSVTYESSSTGNYVTYAQNATVSPSVTPTVNNKNVTWAFSTDPTTFTFTPASQTRWNSISVTYTPSGGSTVAVTGVSLDQATATIKVGKTVTLTPTVTPSDATDKSVSWDSDDETVATVDANGVVTGVSAGTATITAETTDGGFTASCDVTVQAIQTINATVTESLTVISGLQTNEVTADLYCVTGYVTSIQTAYSAEHGNISFWMSDTLGGTNDLEAYRTSCDAAIAAKILVGAQLKVTGNLEKFGNNSVPELVNGTNVVILQESQSDHDEPALVETTLAGFIGATSDAEKAKLYHFSAEVKAITNSTYGNMTLTNGTDDLVVYGSTAKTEALVWSRTGGVYEFTSQNDFSSNELTSTIVAGDTVEVKFIRYTHDSTLQGQGLIISVTHVPTISVSPTTLTLTAEGATGTIEATTTNDGGATVVWTSDDPTVATVSGGTVTPVAEGTCTITAKITVSGVDYTATCAVTVGPAAIVIDSEGVYTLVEDESDLSQGDIVLITNADGSAAMSTTQNSNNRGKTNSGIENNEITISGETSIQVFMLEEYTVGNVDTFAFNTGSGYIYAAGANSNNYMRTTETINDNAKFAISIADGVASIVAQGTASRNTIFYNSQNPGMFSCYSTKPQNTGEDVNIYKKTSAIDPTVPVSITLSSHSESIYANGTVTLTASVNPSTAIPQTVTWLTSDATVATVVGGVVRGVAAGNATITAFADVNENGELDSGEKSATCAVTVTAGSDGQWVESAITSLTSNDVFVIVADNGNTYAMSNNNGTSSAPSAVAVTVSEGIITSTVTDSIKWNVSVSDSSYTFYPDGDDENWLYCTATNNGVRVGTNENSAFTLDAETGYLKHTGTSRYVGVYNSQDWRCYTSTDGNIANQTFKFYKFESSSSYTAADFAAEFLATLSTGTGHVCAADGSTNLASLKAAWKTLAGNWDDVTDKTSITSDSVTPSESGNDYQKTKALYIYIAEKYNTQLQDAELTDYNFMGLTGLTPRSNTRIAIFGTESLDSTNLGAIAIVVTLISATALGGYFLLKKKKTK